MSNVNSIGICLKGDHSKGSYLLLGIILIRYLDRKDIYHLEVKLKKINKKDSINYLKLLLERINYRLTNTNTDNNRNCCMSIDNLKKINFLKD